MRYVFRWKQSGIEVKPSEHSKAAWVWEWAIKWLRPAGQLNDFAAERFIRTEGEVIQVEERKG